MRRRRKKYREPKWLRGDIAEVHPEQVKDCIDAIMVFGGYADEIDAFKAITGGSTFFARWAVFRGQVKPEHWELLEEAERCLC